MARAGQDLQDQYYGDTRFAAATSAAPAEAPALLARLLADLSAFTASQSLADDVTLFVVTIESRLRKA